MGPAVSASSSLFDFLDLFTSLEYSIGTFLRLNPSLIILGQQHLIGCSKLCTGPPKFKNFFYRGAMGKCGTAKSLVYSQISCGKIA